MLQSSLINFRRRVFMDYCEYMRGMIGNSPLIVVRPSVVIIR